MVESELTTTKLDSSSNSNKRPPKQSIEYIMQSNLSKDNRITSNTEVTDKCPGLPQVHRKKLP